MEKLGLNNIDKKQLKIIQEGPQVEFKKSEYLPSSFWETYSSFSNTSGGIIFLGIIENKPENIIVGVKDSKKMIDDLFNNLSNKQKVSYKTVENSDIYDLEVDGKHVIMVKVNEAPLRTKPVYINNKIENTYIRTGSGDHKATKEEIASFMRNASADTDSLLIEECTLEDLDKISVISFKERISIRYPNKNYVDLSVEDFLVEIGACIKRDGILKIKRGTLLFLGKLNSIKEFYHHYHLDYFNRKGSFERWVDRVSDDEPNDVEMNIYNFFNIVLDKLQNSLMESFSLNSSQERNSSHGFDSSIREALINCLAHADYEQTFPSIKIEVLDGIFVFKNPGQLLVTKEQYLSGGDSRPRNEIIMKLFRLLGFSERQGFGGPLIFKTALENSFRHPEIETNINYTELKIWTVDLADSYPDLSINEKSVLKIVIKNNVVSFDDISNYLNISEYYIRKTINDLIDKGFINTMGKGRATKYCLNQNRDEFITQLHLIVGKLIRKL